MLLFEVRWPIIVPNVRDKHSKFGALGGDPRKPGTQVAYLSNEVPKGSGTDLKLVLTKGGV